MTDDDLYRLLVVRGYPQHEAAHIAAGPHPVKQPDEPDGWQPISTAPKDGTAILLYSPTHGIVEGWWAHVEGGGHPENGPPIYWWESTAVLFEDGPYDAPTHWMKRVSPPETKDGK